MSEIKFSNFINEDGSGGPDLVGVTTFTSPYYFVPPSGTTAQRPSGEGLAPGMLRFNTDIGRLEVWRGDHWATILGESPTLDGGARGLFAAGQINPTGNTNTIDYITISTLGNAITFGTLVNGARHTPGSCASSTRGIIAGGSGAGNAIDFITISSTGNSADFGDLTQARNDIAGFSNQTRGIFGGGYVGPTVNTIDYITIASTGNAVDFGDTLTVVQAAGGCASSTRGIIAGGGAPGNSNVIQFVTISTIGNATDFGDLTLARGSLNAGCSNAVRGLFAGGYAPGDQNVIDFITIATTGNASDFGDLSVNRSQAAAASSATRGIFAGGIGGPAPRGKLNTIDYVTIMSTGNAIDFGDLTVIRSALSGLSNAHGGL